MCPTENGVGYSRRIGNQLVWYAEHRALTFGHVFFGTVEEGTGPEFTIPRPDEPHTICPPRPGGREDRIVGRLIDVPKGSSCNFGRTMFQTDTDYSDGTCDWVVHKLLRVGRRDLGCSAWHSFPTLRDLLGVSGVPVSPGYQGFGRENLTADGSAMMMAPITSAMLLPMGRSPGLLNIPPRVHFWVAPYHQERAGPTYSPGKYAAVE